MLESNFALLPNGFINCMLSLLILVSQLTVLMPYVSTAIIKLSVFFFPLSATC